MDSATTNLTVLERITVAPPPHTAAEISLPLTFLDVLWFHVPPVHRLIFYHHPISKSEFLNTLIPKIKNSLSLALNHYSPLAGALTVSPDESTVPEIRYDPGDALELVVAESDSGEAHFNRLVSNQTRNCTEFYPLVPSLPPISHRPDGSIRIPVFALQVTLFPNAGICVGITNHHVVGDANAIFGFMRAWDFFSHRANAADEDLPVEFRPLYDRSVIKDRKGLTKIFWDNTKDMMNIVETHVNRLPQITDKVRATFVLTRDNIQRLKDHVLNRCPKLAHVSTFTVICSFVWNCTLRSRIETNTNNDNNTTDNSDNDIVYFVCAADSRARLNPPVPGNYFGNCLAVGCVCRAKKEQIAGDDGVAVAAEMIGENIRNNLYNDHEDGPLKGAENWFDLFAEFNFDRTLSVAGAPKFDYYELDLIGLGKLPVKFEMPSIDLTSAISLSKAKDCEGGFEVGYSLPVAQMENFIRVFSQNLKDL